MPVSLVCFEYVTSFHAVALPSIHSRQFDSRTIKVCQSGVIWKFRVASILSEATMAINSPPQNLPMTGNQTPPSVPTQEPKYGGFTRFEIELEVSSINSTYDLPNDSDDILHISIEQTLQSFALLARPELMLSSSSNPSPHPHTSIISPYTNTSSNPASSNISATYNTGPILHT